MSARAEEALLAKIAIGRLGDKKLGTREGKLRFRVPRPRKDRTRPEAREAIAGIAIPLEERAG